MTLFGCRAFPVWTVAYDAHDWHGLRLAAVPASPSDVPCVSASTGGASQDPDHASLLLASIPSRVAALHQPGRRARRAFGNGMQRAPDLAEDNAGILLQRAEPCALIVPRCGGRPARQAPASTAATVFSCWWTGMHEVMAPLGRLWPRLRLATWVMFPMRCRCCLTSQTQRPAFLPHALHAMLAPVCQSTGGQF